MICFPGTLPSLVDALTSDLSNAMLDGKIDTTEELANIIERCLKQESSIKSKMGIDASAGSGNVQAP